MLNVVDSFAHQRRVRMAIAAQRRVSDRPSERDLTPTNWKDVVTEISALQDPPLAKPFHSGEVARVPSAASIHKALSASCAAGGESLLRSQPFRRAPARIGFCRRPTMAAA